MGGDNSEKRSEASFLDRVYVLGYRALDFALRGALSRKDARISKLEGDVSNLSEEKTSLASKIVSINVAHDKERIVWAKRVGLVEAENEIKTTKLSGAYAEVHSLEDRLATVQGDLTLAENRLRETEEVLEALKTGVDYMRHEGLQEYHRSHAGLIRFYKEVMNLTDEEAMAKSARFLHEKQRRALEEAQMVIDGLNRVIEIQEMQNIEGRIRLHLEDDKVLIAVDDEQRIKYATEPAKKLLGYDPVGKKTDAIASRLGSMLTHVIPTYEDGFYVEDVSLGSEGKMLEVNMERTRNKTYAGAVLLLIPEKRRGLLYRMRRDSNERLTDAVSKALSLRGEEKVCVELSRITNDVAERIYGLSLSGYFRDKIRVVTRSSEVHSKLKEYGVSEEMIMNPNNVKVRLAKKEKVDLEAPPDWLYLLGS